MSSTIITIQPSLDKEFDDGFYKQLNIKVKQQIINDINKIQTNVSTETPVIIINAPYGSGKTQLLLDMFKWFWKEKRVVALYTKLNTLVNEISDLLSGQDLKIINAINKIIMDKISKIKNDFESQVNKYELLDKYYLPIYFDENISTLKDFFVTYLEIKSIDELNNIIAKNEKINYVLLIDEVENGYKDLNQILKQQGKHLRDFIDELETTKKIIFVMAFGRQSFYEAFSLELTDYSVQRRVHMYTIPSVNIAAYRSLKVDQDPNALWWLTRGRIGWLNNVERTLSQINQDEPKPKVFDEEFKVLKMGNNIPLINVDQIRSITPCRSGDEECEEAFRYLILHSRPLKLSELPGYVKRAAEHNFANIISMCNKLVPADKVAEFFLNDFLNNIEEFKNEFNEDNEIYNEILRYFTQILLSMSAPNDNQVCFGDPQKDFKTYLFDEKKGLYNVLLDMLVSYISDQRSLGDKETQKILDIIERMKNSVARLVNSSKLNMLSIVSHNSSDLDDNNYIILSPYIYKLLYPFPITDPLMINLQYQEIISKVTTILKENSNEQLQGDFNRLTSELLRDNKLLMDQVIILPLVSNKDIDANKILDIMKNILLCKTSNLEKAIYLKYVLSVKETDEIFVKIKNKIENEPVYHDLKFLKKNNFISIHGINDSLINDFIISLYINYILNNKSIRLTDENQRQRYSYYKTALLYIVETFSTPAISSPEYKKKYEIRLSDTCTKYINRWLDYGVKSPALLRLTGLLVLTSWAPTTSDNIWKDIGELFDDKRIFKLEHYNTFYRETIERIMGDDKNKTRVNPCHTLMDELHDNEVIKQFAKLSNEILFTNTNYANNNLFSAANKINNNEPPLFKYFQETFSISSQAINKDQVKDLYKAFMFYMFLTDNKTLVLKELREEIYKKINDNLKKDIKDIEERIKTINEIIRTINSLDNIKIEKFDIVSYNDSKRTLDKEIDMIKKMMEYLENVLNSNITSDYIDYLNLVILTSKLNEEDTLLDNISNSLKNMRDNVLDRLSNSLLELQTKLNDLFQILKPDTTFKGDIIIRYTESKKNGTDDVNNVFKKIKDLNDEINSLDNTIKTVNSTKQNIKKIMENMLKMTGERK